MSTPQPLSSLTGTTTPVVNQALEPASVRDGSPAVQQAYDEALSFESVLVNQLCQQLAASSGLTGDSDSLDGDSSDGATTADFGSLLPGALASSIMSDGGLGLAAQIYPSFESSAATIATSGEPAVSTSGTSAAGTSATGDSPSSSDSGTVAP